LLGRLNTYGCCIKSKHNLCQQIQWRQYRL
jgi:hypothetical protein